VRELTARASVSSRRESARPIGGLAVTVSVPLGRCRRKW
jgi:hypothetical protein